MKKILIMLLIALLAAMPALAETTFEPAYATPEEEIAALRARIEEQDAIIANLEERLARYESVVAVTTDPEADVITFDGGSVKLGEAQAAYDEIAVLYEQFGVSEAEYSENLKSEVLNNLAEVAILTMKAQELGVYENTPEQQAAAEQEAQETYDSAIAYYLPYFLTDGVSEEDAREQTVDYMRTEGITYDTLLKQTLQSQWQQRLYDVVTADIVVTEDDIRAMYDTGLASAKELYADPYMYEYDYVSGEMILTHPEGYREVAYIALPYTEEETAMDVDARLASVNARYSDLITRALNGEDLTALGEEFMLFDYGTLPIREDAALMSPEVNTAAMALAMGETSTPIDDTSVAWVLRYVSDITPGDVPFESIKDIIAESALGTARDDAFNAQVEQWLIDANITMYPNMIQ